MIVWLKDLNIILRQEMMLKKINLITTQCSHYKLSFNLLPNVFKNNPSPTSTVILLEVNYMRLDISNGIGLERSLAIFPMVV